MSSCSVGGTALIQLSFAQTHRKVVTVKIQIHCATHLTPNTADTQVSTYKGEVVSTQVITGGLCTPLQGSQRVAQTIQTESTVFSCVKAFLLPTHLSTYDITFLSVRHLGPPFWRAATYELSSGELCVWIHHLHNY